MLGLGSSLSGAGFVGGLVFPNELAGIQFWFRGTNDQFGQTSTIDEPSEGTFRWQDSSGNNNHATQTNADHTPDDAAENGSYLRFSHLRDDHLSLTSAITIPTADGTEGAYTLCAVVKPASYGGTQNTLISADVNDFFELQNDDQIRLNYDSGTSVLHPKISNRFSAPGLYVITITRTAAGAHALYRNTFAETLAGANTSNLTNTNDGSVDCIGARDKATPDRGFDGDIYELLWITGDPSLTLNPLHEYMTAKWESTWTS